MLQQSLHTPTKNMQHYNAVNETSAKGTTGPRKECTQQLQQLAIVRTLSWPAGMLRRADTAVACTPVVYAN